MDGRQYHPDQLLKRLVLTTGVRARTLSQLERARRTHYGGGTSDAEYALRPTLELVELINAGDATVSEAVGAASVDIARAIDAIVERLATGGRLVYVGAGTSGGLAALDAQECETTFSTPAGQVVALTAADPAAEDDRDGGAQSIGAAGISAADAVVGITASGRTPYVVGALQAAFDAGALTIALVCVPDSSSPRSPSTRSPSSSAPSSSPARPAQSGDGPEARPEHDLDGRDDPARQDLRQPDGRRRGREREAPRAGTPHRRTATGASSEDVDEALEASGGEAKVAIVSLLAEVDADTARARLRDANGNVRLALSP